MSHAEARYARACRVPGRGHHAAAALARGEPSGWFTGEWSFRWRMQELGWRFYAGQALPSGALLARPANASPGPCLSL
ncbi:MAG: hypothetical protein H6741_14960 [Alphaproteobacteria bacterium]|nr:hypothetical protein [Alphaproteobacteria bacterium]